MTTVPGGGGRRRAILTIGDQCLASLSNAFVGVAVGHLTGARNLGGFSLAYGLWLTVGTLHRAIVTDPMTIEGDGRTSDRQRLRQGFAAAALVGLSAALLFGLAGLGLLAVGQPVFAKAMLTVGAFLPFLVLQDYWRRLGFMLYRPARALANDAVFDCTQAVAFGAVLLADVRSPLLIIAGWGAGAVVGTFVGLGQFHVRPTLRGGIGLVRARWQLIKWMVAAYSAGTGQTQASNVIGGAILGPVGLGGLNAASTLSTGPAMVLVQAGGSVGLPEATLAFAERGWTGLRKVSAIVTALTALTALASGAVVATAGRRLLELIYGQQFGRYWVAADVLALSLLVGSLAIGPIIVLKVMRRTRPLFRCQVTVLVATIAVLPVLAILYGVTGAAWAAVVVAVLQVVLLRVFALSARRAALRPSASAAGEGERGRFELAEQSQT